MQQQHIKYYSHHRTQHGFVLLTVLLGIALLMIVISSLVYQHHQLTKVVAQIKHQHESELALIQSEQLIASQIKELLSKNIPMTSQLGIQQVTLDKLPQYRAEYRLIDASGLLDINMIWNANQSENTAISNVVNQVFKTLQPTNPPHLDIVLDALDNDTTLRPMGAEQDYYDAITPRIVLPNTAFSSLSTLTTLKGFNNITQDQLAYYFNQQPINPPQKINVNVMPTHILTAMFPNISPAAIESFIINRDKTAKNYSLNEFFSTPPFSSVDENLKSTLSNFLGDQSFLFYALITIENTAQSGEISKQRYKVTFQQLKTLTKTHTEQY